MPSQQTPKEPGTGFELGLLVLAVAAIGAAAVTWLGARLAAVFSGGTVGGGLTDWLAVAARLLTGHSPTNAWGDLATDLPPAPVYWICTALVAAVAVAAGLALYRLWRRVAGPGERRRFGQPTEAREATPADVVPIVVDTVSPPTGRMLLGQMLPHGPVLATEDRQRHPLALRRTRRQGNRGSVALIGPTGSGKTALVATAMITWTGPVVAVSVKRDLYDITAAAREGRGDIAVFDPGMATGLPTARWSPLQAVTTSTGVLRTGRALGQAIPRGGVTNADYWAKHGERLLAAFMGVAGISRLLRAGGLTSIPAVNMQHIATWVTMMSDATDPAINMILKAGLDKRQPLEVRLIARHASTTFVGVGREDHRVRSSIYSTASHAIDPWLEPSVAHSATDDPRRTYAGDATWKHRPRFIDLEWLMSGEPGRGNTLYLTATQPEFERLSPVLGGLLCDLKDTIHAWDVAGRRLDKPLMILIDEAGQLELGWLPTEVSTIAALGAFFVTCWQNLAQIHHRYGTLADAVLSGHRSKCFFAGVDDLTTMKYLTGLLGSEYVTRLSTSHDVPSAFGGSAHPRRSVSRAEQRVDFAPANAIRQMNPGEAVLIHGTLPPIHLEAIRWWERPELAGRVPLGPNGEPAPRANLPTCPLSDKKAGERTPLIDEQTVTTTLAELPGVRKHRARGNSSAATNKSTGDGQMEFPKAGSSAADEQPTERRPVRDKCACAYCNKVLMPGDGQLVKRDGRDISSCYPPCCEEAPPDDEADHKEPQGPVDEARSES